MVVDEGDPGVPVTRDVVRAFQLRGHHLVERVEGERALLDVAGACGVQDSPPGSAAVAIGARVADLTADAVEQALEGDRTLVRTWAMRGAPFIVPTADLPVFTTGVLPPRVRAITSDAVRRGPSPPSEAFPELRERERQVLGMIAQGLDNATIAERLGLSGKTVANYVSTILTHLRVRDRAAAAQLAQQRTARS